MAGRMLASTVYLDGVTYGPSGINPPPEDIARRITNPAAWGDESPEDSSPPAVTSEVAAEPAQPATPTRTQAPPRAGAGSGVTVWRAYASQHNIPVPADSTRDQIIEACEKAGLA